MFIYVLPTGEGVSMMGTDETGAPKVTQTRAKAPDVRRLALNRTHQRVEYSVAVLRPFNEWSDGAYMPCPDCLGGSQATETIYAKCGTCNDVYVVPAECEACGERSDHQDNVCATYIQITAPGLCVVACNTGACIEGAVHSEINGRVERDGAEIAEQLVQLLDHPQKLDVWVPL